jgi:glycosyltransferase involved in cell wall biosynthesis
MAGRKLSKEIEDYIQKKGIFERVIIINDVSSSDLNLLYSGADLFVFPSIQEGFGWPIIEAQASGTVVATTNRAPMNEIAGDSAIYIDPDDIKRSADIIDNEFEAVDNERINRGIDNSHRFSVDAMINSYIENYINILNKADKIVKDI